MNFKMYYTHDNGSSLCLHGLGQWEEHKSFYAATQVAVRRATECVVAGPELDWTGWEIEIVQVNNDGDSIQQWFLPTVDLSNYAHLLA